MKINQIKLALVSVYSCFAMLSHGGTAGVDLSEHNRLIDGDQVKQHYFFAYIEANKGLHKDAAFKDNWLQARQAGLPIGPYLYVIPAINICAQTELFVDSVQTTNKEVNCLLKQCVNESLPPVVDLEDAAKWKRAIPGLSKRVQTILACLETIRNRLGADPILYMSPSFAEEVLGNDPQFGKYELWVAQYSVAAPNVPKPWSHWRFWQWKNTGHQRGVTGENECDFDYFNGSLVNLHELMCSIN